MKTTEIENAFVTIGANTKGLDDAVPRVKQATDTMKSMLKSVAALGVGIGAAQLIREAVQLGDAYTSLNARLKLVTNGTAELQRAQRELFRIAQQSRQGFEGVADLYGRVARASKEIGATQQQILDFTEGVGNALTISGTTASQASGALLQLGQALGGGVIQAQEFNSLIDGTPRLLQAVADGMDGANGSVARLRKMVIDGKVSSREFFEAFLRGSKELKAEAESIPTTVEGSMTQLRNTLLQVVGQFNDAAGVTAALSQYLSELAKQSDDTASKATTFGNAVHWVGVNLREVHRLIAGTGELLFGLGGAMATLLTMNEDGTTRSLARMRDALEAMKTASANIADWNFGWKTEGAVSGADAIRNARKGAVSAAPLFKPITVGTGDASKAAEALADVRKEMTSLLASFRDDSPIKKFAAEVATFTKHARDAKLPPKELAGNLAVLNEQLARMRAIATAEAGAALDELMASMTTTAVDDLTLAISKQAAELRKKADAELADANGSGKLAQKYYEAAEAVEREGSEVVQATAALEELQRVRDALARQPDGVFSADLNLDDQVASLKVLRDKLTSEKARQIVTEAIDDLEKGIYNTKSQTVTVNTAIASQTTAIAGHVEDAVRFALGLNQAFGDTNSTLGKTLTNVLAIAGGIRSLSEKASNAGGYENLFSSTKGLLSAIPVIGGIIGGVISLGQTFYQEKPEEKAAREASRANTHALTLLTQRIGDIATSDITANQLKGLRSALFDAARTPIGNRNGADTFTSAPAGTKVNIDAFYTKYGLSVEDVQKIAKQLGITLDGTAGSLRALYSAIEKIDFSAMTQSVSGLQSIFELLRKLDGAQNGARTLADTKEIVARLGSPELRASLSEFDTSTEAGRAGLRAFLNNMVRQLIAGSEEAFAQLGDMNMQDFLTLVGQLVGGIDEITESLANGAATLQPALQRLGERTRLFGLTAAQILDGTLDAYGNAIPAIQGLFNDLDLSTKDGVESAKQRLQGLYDSLTADGVQDGEQAIIDALLAIVEALNSAGADILSIADELAQRGQQISEKFGTASSKAADFQKFNTAYGANPDLVLAIKTLVSAALAAGADVPTGVGGGQTIPGTRDGLLAYRGEITAKYNALNEDGIDAAEQATVDILSQLIDAIDAALREFEPDPSAFNEDARNVILKRVNGQATLDRALGTGANQQVVNRARAYGGVFAELIGSIGDVDADSIQGTRIALQDWLKQVVDGRIPLEQLGALTEDQFSNAVVELLNGLTEISNSFTTAADKMRADAAEIEGIQFDTIDAKGGDSRVARFDSATAAQREKYLAAGKDAAFLAAYDELRKIQRRNLESEISNRVSQQLADASRSESASSGATPRSELAGVTEGAFRVQTGVLQSSLLVQRRGVELQEKMYALWAGGFPALNVPALPPTVGGFVSAGSNLSGATTLNVNVRVTADGVGSKRLADMAAVELRELARKITPEISHEMRLRATNLSALKGRTR